ncbi:hypothetical protein CC80DRAFT_540815 [Byssothecium circinans]|uniref:Ubiquitin-like domain-containing protein n=1 Tax=Byssothecium circinans TaxID=147558 RepID=A0A6A5TD24_9PLEO|nr:hypothetical protein CC80DRAFT_540815 [Byssothecium circinans]
MAETDVASRSESSLDRPGESSEKDKRAIYVRDHAYGDYDSREEADRHVVHREYVLPWELGKDWTQFHAFVAQIYERPGLEVHLKAIQENKFDVLDNRLNIIMPSVWGTAVQPGDTVKISFWDLENEEPVRIRERSGPAERPRFVRVDPNEGQETRFPRQPSPRRDESIYNDSIIIEVDERSSASEGTDESEEEPEAPPYPEPLRNELPALDQDGNRLSFTVNLWRGLPPDLAKQEVSNGEQTNTARDMSIDNLKITKAINVETEGRATVQIHTLPGPDNSAFSSSIGIRWYHVYADMLDWNSFKTTCSTIPGLSERLQKVVRGTLQKVEKDKLEPFLGGMFIEPGTILRGDNPIDSDAQSVIFSCIPYFDIQKPSKIASARVEHLHPARTLMQSYYPNEPVRDRDEEQAYRKFGNGRKDDLVHVPSMWIMNIGPDTVVTCGYRPLSDVFVKSLAVVPEDLKQLGNGAQSNKLTKIRLSDWDERVLLFSLDECRTWFEMERKLQELNSSRGQRRFQNLTLFYKSLNGLKRVTPKSWLCILNQRNLIFIDLQVASKSEGLKIDDEITADDCQSSQPSLFSKTLVPPFFHWPSSAAAADEGSPDRLIPNDVKRSIHCLEVVEKSMAKETLLKIAKMDEAFANDSVEKIRVILRSQNQPTAPLPNQTFHQTFVESKCSLLLGKVNNLIETVYETSKLFVSDVDKSTLLRKVWGGMGNVIDIVERISKIGVIPKDPREYSNPDWKPPLTGHRSWQIRRPTKKQSVPIPPAGESFVASIKDCRDCKRHIFTDPNAALEHLRTIHPTAIPSAPGTDPTVEDDQLKDWICNKDQALIEKTVTSTLAFLEQAVETACSLRDQLQELADGVRDETGALAELYTLPRKLVETFRRLIIFYLAIERGLHFLEKYYKSDHNVEQFIGGTVDLSPKQGAAVLRRLGEDAAAPLLQARENLGDMARSSTHVDVAKRISLSPEYICSWLMRRLIVKPLERSMTIADMYREYLSTLQFQVNHRPGKRLLRSINLLQEELMVLSTVNNQQTQLISNYMAVLDAETYPTDRPSRRSMYPYERLVLTSCLESLALTSEEYADQIRRCGPLSDSTKQSAEINEEDHGKAILVFTVVTIIFLPLSFITSFLGMNTSDIRDMDNTQSLFWSIALPLTTVVMGTILFIAYNGDELRDRLSDLYRTLTGKQQRRISTRGISIAQRKRAARGPSDTSSSTADFKSLADEAEYASPRPDWTDNWYDYGGTTGAPQPPMLRSKVQATTYADMEDFWPIKDADWSYPVPRRRKARRHIEPPQPYLPPLNTRSHIRRTDPEFTYPSYPPLSRPAARYTPGGYKSGLPPQPPQPPPPPPIQSTQPTFFRIHNKHIAPETLAHYALPWEPDPKDKNYVIVKQGLDEAEMGVLFEHSRRVREAEDRGGTEVRGARRDRGRRGRRGSGEGSEESEEWYGEGRGGRVYRVKGIWEGRG